MCIPRIDSTSLRLNTLDPGSDVKYLIIAFATIDNDGTLWTEKPLYNHLYVVLAKIDDLIKEDPSLLQDSTIQALYEFSSTNNIQSLSYLIQEIKEHKYLDVVGQLFGRAFEGLPVDSFAHYVHNFCIFRFFIFML